jgi:hypothetical protein
LVPSKKAPAIGANARSLPPRSHASEWLIIPPKLYPVLKTRDWSTQ